MNKFLKKCFKKSVKIKIPSDSRYKICKCLYQKKSRIYYKLLKSELAWFHEWNTTIGNQGSMEYCWECFKQGKHKEM